MKDKTNFEFDAFTKFVDLVLAVPHTEIVKWEKKYQERVAQNPKRRGPKRKPKTSADGHESGEEG
jgi:hypothetical protein